MTGLRGVLTFESMYLSYLPQKWLLEPSKLLEHAFNVWCMPEFLQCTAHIRLVSWPKQSHYESHRIADVTRPRVLTSQGTSYVLTSQGTLMCGVVIAKLSPVLRVPT